MIKNELIEILEKESIEIIIKYRIPYLCNGTSDNYGVIRSLSIGDNNITGYNGICKENISQELMNNIKKSIIKTINEYDK